METRFTEEQLANPPIKRANEILRTCVHCGFCLATCPTYQVLGDELDSPRGRIYLIKDMLETGRPADEKTVKHIDRCLSCLACMSTCPSDVHYMHLVDYAREYIEETYKRPLTDRLLRKMLKVMMTNQKLFGLSLLFSRFAKPFASFMPDRRLRTMLSLSPSGIKKAEEYIRGETFFPEDKKKFRVALLMGCVQQAINPSINQATISLLTRLGCEVVVPTYGCCGALPHHMGSKDECSRLALGAINSLIEEMDGDGLDAIIINTSGCGTTIKDYGYMFQNHPSQKDAERVAEMAVDITEFIDRVGFPFHEKPSIRVGYHAACSLQHGQGIKTIPKELLKSAGFEVVEPLNSHLCCGSAGTYNMLQPEISKELRTRKIDTLEAKKPDIIATGNIGCMVQISAGTNIPVVHTVELLDWISTPSISPKSLDTLKADFNC